MSKQNYRVLWYTYKKYTYEGGNTMALIKCPECGKEFSDKAQACPNCGCPTSEAKNQELKQEEIKEDPEFELQLENDYSLKIVSDTVKLFYQNGFILESDVRGFVLNWLSEEEDLGRNQLKVVFSHPGYKKPMKLSVSNTSERYEKAKYFAENVAEKYFKKDICPGYFEAIHYAEQHVDNVLFRKSYENEQRIIKEKKQTVQNQANNQQIQSKPTNSNTVPVQNVQIQSTTKKRGGLVILLCIVITLIVVSVISKMNSRISFGEANLLSYIIAVLILWIPITVWEYNKFPKCTRIIERNVNGKIIKQKEIYCPVCGNTELENIVMPVGTSNFRITSSFSSGSLKYAKFSKCSKCGNAFCSSMKPTPIRNLFFTMILGFPLMFVVLFIFILLGV